MSGPAFIRLTLRKGSGAILVNVDRVEAMQAMTQGTDVFCTVGKWEVFETVDEIAAIMTGQSEEVT